MTTTDLASKLASLKARIDRLRTERDRTQGALAQLTERLQSEHGCASVGAGEKKLAKLERQEADAARALRDRTAAFVQKWEKVI